MCHFVFIYYFALLCICPLMCFLYIPNCTCVHICFSLMAFICCLFVIYFCSYVLFVYISVICMCISHMQECGLYVSFTKHTILIQNSEFAGYRVFWLFICLSVCVLCVIWFYTIYFFPPSMHDSIPPICPVVCPFSVV